MTAPHCARFRSLFDDHHDGLLSPALSEFVQNHLNSCATCREEYGLLVSCIGVIRGLEAPAVPPRALRKIVDSLSGPGGGSTLPDRIFGPDLDRGLETS
ncbi:MAG TPA: zf-HC2 domain-containing protein [Planctomycetota bacterium]|nr:zf-HC2 domain-containing protein [Planctomycetota bacterium]